MSMITLQFGQCGNQIGQALFSILYNDIKPDQSNKLIGKCANAQYISEAVNKWFHVNKKGKFEARSVLIDTEKKVVAQANINIPYRFKNVMGNSHGGSANNWAFGYSSKSKLMLGDIKECVRKEMERCDFVSGIFSVLGSAGGTGSGVGSRTIEVLRDEYPTKIMINTIVLPYRSGEVVTQNYNSLLTLAKLYDITDATYLYENDVLHRMCNKSLSLTNITFRDINSIIAQQLAAVLQPVSNVSVSRIVANLTAHPSYKLIQVKSVPHVSKEHSKYESSTTWAVLANMLRSSFRSEFDGRKLKCLGNMLVSRGGVAPADAELKALSDVALYVPWLPSQVRFTNFHQTRGLKDLSRFLVVSTNNNSVCGPLDFILEDAWMTYTNGAYLHHYKKFDVDEDCFTSAFRKLEGILRDYTTV